MADKKTVTQARMKVPYGKFRTGETIRGTLAATLVDNGMAEDISPKVKATKATKATKSKKDQGAAPENKTDDTFEV